MGWEAADAAALDVLAARLSNAGAAVEAAPRAARDQRFVTGMIRFADPEGNRIELFHGAQVADDPFAAGRPISGFKTGALGMGHAVLKTRDVDAPIPFHTELLGFRISDYMRAPLPLCFFHCNARRHSFAIAGTGARGFHHSMVEYGMLDDVGQGHDLALTEEGRLAFSLGSHSDDWMTSFYTHGPSGFFFESGFGGRLIEPETWAPCEMVDEPSLWGHDRLYIEEGPRRPLEEKRLDLARHGLRAPNRPWLESLGGGA